MASSVGGRFSPTSEVYEFQNSRPLPKAAENILESVRSAFRVPLTEQEKKKLAEDPKNIDITFGAERGVVSEFKISKVDHGDEFDDSPLVPDYVCTFVFRKDFSYKPEDGTNPINLLSSDDRLHDKDGEIVTNSSGETVYEIIHEDFEQFEDALEILKDQLWIPEALFKAIKEL
ncbi:MAG: hypothetical protein JSS32_03495 [Verrucomicrobia bacterium]|nr:hypothetical protein [Verrucomicrobiota bacterium]